ncbi:MAG TPA: YetF domain-containing protein [Herpetosiphonaceae bacterium]
MFANVDWTQVFLPDTPILEIVVRGSIMYLALFWLMRGILKRVASSISMADLLMVVVIADAAQNGMADDYRSVGDGIVLVLTIIFWNYTLDWLGYHFPAFQRFVHPPPLPLVKDGTMLRQNMRRELITEGELMSQIHEQGLSDLSQVRAAHMEGDGRISVIGKDGHAPRT